MLDSGNLFTNLKNDYRYRVPLYPFVDNLLELRSSNYKTKYLKSYKTQLLLDLPLQVFQNKDGHWKNQGLEASLEFSAIERACGKFFVLPEILYRIPKSEIESEIVVN